MRILILTLTFFLICASSVQASEEGLHAEMDYLKIGYIPSRGAVHQGSPYKKLKAESLAHHKSPKIAAFYQKVKAIGAKGITDNTVKFHQATVYLEVKYQGDTIRLSYTGPSDKEEYKAYEREWSTLHKEVFSYLTANLRPKI